MFWRSRSPLEADDEAWQIDCWLWLLTHFGGVGAVRQRRFVLPNPTFFSRPAGGAHEIASGYFVQAARYFGFEPDNFQLVAQDEDVEAAAGPMQIIKNAPHGPAGTFQRAASGAMTITYNPALVGRPGHLIATFAHELCHARLSPIASDPPGGPEMEEFATDLAVTFFGFGVFSANTASTFSAYRDDATGTQGWRFERRGYLSPAERAFALALFLKLRGEEEKKALDHLESGPEAYFRKAWKYLSSHPEITEEIEAGDNDLALPGEPAVSSAELQDES